MDSKNFCSILETLVPVSMSNASNFEKYTTLLMEIWASASSELKQSAIVDTKLWQSIGSKYIIRMDRETSDFRARRQISDPMKFIRLVLKSTNNTQKRIEFFGKNFCWLIVLAPFAEVDKLMRDFLECHQRDNIEMKKEIANSDEIDECLWTLLRFGEFDDFDAAISFYFPGVGGFVEDDDVMRYKWALMSNARGLNMLSSCLYFADWRALYDYVKKINSQTRRIAPDEFMISLIEQDHYPAVFDLTVKLCQGEMKDVREFVNAILSPTDDRLERLKKRFKDHMGKNLFSDFWLIERVERVFNRADVQDFMLWIYNGDDELIDGIYKKPVFQFLPSGFLVQLKFCFTDNCFHATKSMEEFLEWCFATEAERRQFKLDMIHKYREYKTIEDLLTARRYRRSALFWFFDGDLSAIEKFTADCARNPMNSYVAIMGN
ncbi:uncharacterized protein LOC135837955 [Planococcus citri]|uniref:uncharacterized protein LOC135837955 n=1 Tax=Planococcus citri TaxID=170843 RepID=UPI0031F8B1B0